MEKMEIYDHSHKYNHNNQSKKAAKKRSSVVIIAIVILAVVLTAFVVISGNGTNGWIDANVDNGTNQPDVPQLEAKSPVEFPQEPIVMTLSTEKKSSYDNPGNIDGTIKYTINGVETYDNLSDAGIAYSELFERFRIGEFHYQIYSIDQKKTIEIDSNNLVDGKTGKFINDCYFLLFEVEITNVDAVYDVQDSTFNYLNTDIFRGTDLFTLWYYHRTTDFFSKGYSCSNLVYVRENAEAESGVWGTVKLSKGQPTKLNLGFIVLDNTGEAFTRMGLKLCDKSVTDCDENRYIYWFNLSKIIEEYQNSRGLN